MMDVNPTQVFSILDMLMGFFFIQNYPIRHNELSISINFAFVVF